jgi:hypothetical protein
MNIGECEVCGKDIKMQCMVSTGVCCGNCEKGRAESKAEDADSSVR